MAFSLLLEDDKQVGKGDLWLDFNKLGEERMLNVSMKLTGPEFNAEVGDIKLSYAWETEEVLSLKTN